LTTPRTLTAGGRPIPDPLVSVIAGIVVAAGRRSIPETLSAFLAYCPMLDEATEALDRAGRFLSAHLDGA
jgi:hypothetical protein